MYLENINGPEDVKKLNDEQMTALAEEMRAALLKRASIHGGHLDNIWYGRGDDRIALCVCIAKGQDCL